MVSRIQAILLYHLSEPVFKFRHRLRVPSSFIDDPIVLAFLLQKALQNHDNYLDLSRETIAIEKLVTLEDFIDSHDKWLGKLETDHLSNISDPFFRGLNNTDDHLKELVAFGWVVVDVEGDGNCGYYYLILGLHNNGNHRYNVARNPRSAVPMNRNPPWQQVIMQLRTELRNESMSLLRGEYPPSERNTGWFMYREAVVPVDFEKLSEEFLCKELTQQQYFDGTLTAEKVKGCTKKVGNYRSYQMSPYWATYCFSSLLGMRVIVYTRTGSWENDQVTYTWSTTTMDPTAPIAERIVQKDNLNRISDMEFKRSPTVEILFTTELTGAGHFQFLRRILCDNTIRMSEESPDTLSDYLQQDNKPNPMYEEFVREINSTQRINPDDTSRDTFEMATDQEDTTNDNAINSGLSSNMAKGKRRRDKLRNKNRKKRGNNHRMPLFPMPQKKAPSISVLHFDAAVLEVSEFHGGVCSGNRNAEAIWEENKVPYSCNTFDNMGRTYSSGYSLSDSRVTDA